MEVVTMPEAPISYNLADMAWPDIKPFTEGDRIVLIPVGSIEQHGPHMPVGTDAYHCQEVAERAGPLAKVPYAPTLFYGYSPHHIRKPGTAQGTITLRAETTQAAYYDIGRSLIHMGFTKLIFINGNASNFKVMDPVMRRLKYETGALIVVYKPYLENYMGLMADQVEKPDDLERIKAETPGWHSSELETSQAMAHDPRLVHMDRLTDWEKSHKPDWLPDAFSKEDGFHTIQFQGYEYFYMPFEHDDYSATGVIGNPFYASREKGDVIYDRFAHYLADAIDEFRKIPVDIRNVEFTNRV
jgi:creatinine amidohydrolase